MLQQGKPLNQQLLRCIELKTIAALITLALCPCSYTTINYLKANIVHYMVLSLHYSLFVVYIHWSLFFGILEIQIKL